MHIKLNYPHRPLFRSVLKSVRAKFPIEYAKQIYRVSVYKTFSIAMKKFLKHCDELYIYFLIGEKYKCFWCQQIVQLRKYAFSEGDV